MAFQLATAAVMNVGATVVRPPPVLVVERGRILVRAGPSIRVSAEGGRLTRDRDGSAIVIPEGRLVRIELIY